LIEERKSAIQKIEVVIGVSQTMALERKIASWSFLFCVPATVATARSPEQEFINEFRSVHRKIKKARETRAILKNIFRCVLNLILLFTIISNYLLPNKLPNQSI
jgi:hypothetical protein